MIGKLDPDERVLSDTEPMQLTPDLINQINEKMAHTKKDGSFNWLTTDDYEIQIAGTFAADRFIVIKNKRMSPVVSAAPHPYFDYEKNVFTEDGRDKWMKDWMRDNPDDE